MPIDDIDDIVAVLKRNGLPVTLALREELGALIEPAGGSTTVALSPSSGQTWLDGPADVPLSGGAFPSLESEAALEQAPVDASRYQSLGLLGEGGMGEIYRVHDTRLRRTVAMKVIRPQYRVNAWLRRRFVSEAQATAQLRHPSIIRVYDLGQLEDGRFFFTMPEVTGDPLAERIATYHRGNTGDAGNTGDLRPLLQVLADACEGVAYAHDRGVLHRDLSPDNILVGPDGQGLVIDWGLFRLLDRAHEAGELTTDYTLAGGQTQPGTVAGTPAFMSPEQAAGQVEALDERTDVYGLGAVLYTMLTGRLPYRGATNRDVVDAVLAGPPAPAEATPRAPASLVRICQRAMARNPGERFPTAAALLTELRA